MVVAIAHAAARLMQRSPSLGRLSKSTAAAVQRGVMVAARCHCQLIADEARVLRAWCHAEAEALYHVDAHAAKLLEGAAADITAALVAADDRQGVNRSQHG